MSVLVLDQRKRPVTPCCEKRARLLLERGRAVVHRRYPFRLKDRVGGDVVPVRVKLDPGNRTSAVVADQDGKGPARVLCLFELAHWGRQISEALMARRASRRRGANLGYRPPRFDNTRKPQGWLAPRLQHRVDTCISWLTRLHRSAALSEWAMPTESMPNPANFAIARTAASTQPALPPRPKERGFQL